MREKNIIKPIAVIGLTNTSGIEIYDINDEQVLAKLTNKAPRWYKLYTNTKGTFFNLAGRQYLDQAIRTNI